MSREGEVAGSQSLVRTGGYALATRSSALVQRGLRDLARDSNWLVKKLFSGSSPRLAISPDGQVCAISPLDRRAVRRTILYDIEMTGANMVLTAPGEASTSPQKSQAAFAWRPGSQHLIAAWNAWSPELHAFDLQGKMFCGSFGKFREFPEWLAWSETGRYLAVTFPAGKGPALQVWEAGASEPPTQARLLAETGAPAKIESQAYGEGFEEEGRFRGYGHAAFSPDESMIAAVAQIKGEWADDVLLLAAVPDIGKQALFQTQGHITCVAWTPNSREIIYCAAGQAYRLAATERRPKTLPFGAELAACHPHLPLCLCFSSWLKNSAKGSLFLVDLQSLSIFDEWPAEGVVDLRWSAGGTKAYAVAQSGLAYIYEPPLL